MRHDSDSPLSTTFIGRAIELKQLNGYLEKAANGIGNTIVISGEAGVGKTTLVDELVRRANAKNFLVLSGECISQASDPYQPFISALNELTDEELFVSEPESFTNFGELFLINNAGLLMAYASQAGDERPKRIIGSMLTAVQDFVKDSFGDDSLISGLGRLDYGAKKILIEHGSYIFIAGVIEREEPPHARADMQNVLHELEDRYSSMIEHWDGDLSRVRGFKDYLSALLGKRYHVIHELEKEKLEAKQAQMFDRIRALITTCTDKPILVLIEDIHWADDGSLSLLEYLSRAMRNEPILVCCTYRSDELNRSVETLLTRMYDAKLAVELCLRAFTEKECYQLLNTLLCSSKISSELVKKISDGSDGNPFYAKELIQMFHREKLIQFINGAWQLVKEPELVLPTNIIELVSKRIERLNAEGLRIVECAATIGQEFSGRLLAKCLDVDTETLIPQLSVLETNKILSLSDEKNEIYQFEHAIIHDVVYNETSVRWRRINHQTVGTVLENTYKKNLDVVISQLAHHFTKANSAEKAVIYSIRAGEKSNTLYALDDALQHYDNALTFLRSYVSAEKNNTMKSVLLRLGELSRIRGHWDEALAHYTELLQLSDKLNDKHTLVEAHRNIGFIHASKAEYARGLSALERALEISETANDFQGISATYYNLGGLYWRKGDLGVALHSLRKCIELSTKINDKQLLTKAYIDMGVVYQPMGEYDKSIELLKRSLDLTKDTGNKYETVRVYNDIGVTYYYQNKFDKAIPWYEKCIKMSKTIGYIDMTGYGLCNAALSYARMDKVAKSQGYIEDAKHIFEKLGEKRMLIVCHVVMGVINECKKNWHKAISNFKSGIKIAEEIGAPEFLPQVYLEFGKMYKAMDDKECAIKQFREARKLYGKFGNNQKVAEINKYISGLEGP